MIIIVGFLLAALSVPLAGGKLSRLAELEIRSGHLVVVSVVVQTILLKFPNSSLPSWLAEGIHVYTYALAFAFLVLNRHIAGLWMVTGGAIGNAIAIGANHGVMPASTWATRVAGMAATEGFSNSAVVDRAHVRWLGDVFAIPAGWPFANVFSVGDVMLVVGAAVLMHRVCASRFGGPEYLRARPPAAMQRAHG